MFTDFYRIVGRMLPDCFRNFTEFGGAGLRIVYGFLPDFAEEAAGLFMDFWEEASRLFTDFYRILGRRLPDC